MPRASQSKPHQQEALRSTRRAPVLGAAAHPWDVGVERGGLHGGGFSADFSWVAKVYQPPESGDPQKSQPKGIQLTPNTPYIGIGTFMGGSLAIGLFGFGVYSSSIEAEVCFLCSPVGFTGNLSLDMFLIWSRARIGNWMELVHEDPLSA